MNKEHNIFESFGFAISGIKESIKLNRNLKLHIFFGVIVLIASFFFRLSFPEIGIIVMVIALVIGVEMVNTAIEEVVDLVTKDYREEAKYAKDVSAGMVLVVACGSIIVGILVFLPHILYFLGI